MPMQLGLTQKDVLMIYNIAAGISARVGVNNGSGTVYPST